MRIDQNKLRELVAQDLPPFSPDELRRQDNVFFVGGNLPERETLETLYESHFQSNAALFHLTFGDIASFPNAETLARMIKKNFNAHLVGRLDFAAPPQLIERAYAAGVDIIDIPLPALAGRDDADEEPEVGARIQALHAARSVFPRWSVASTLTAGGAPLASTMAAIDALLNQEVVPLLALSNGAAKLPEQELCQLFSHLQVGWRVKKAIIKPLLPLIVLSTPLVRASSGGGLRGFIDLIDGRRLLATSDLRRLLRVKEVEESFASSGL